MKYTDAKQFADVLEQMYCPIPNGGIQTRLTSPVNIGFELFISNLFEERQMSALMQQEVMEVILDLELLDRRLHSIVSDWLNEFHEESQFDNDC